MMEPGDLRPHLPTQVGVEVAERFVEEEHLGLPHDGAPQGDTLSLSARERLGFLEQEPSYERRRLYARPGAEFNRSFARLSSAGGRELPPPAPGQGRRACRRPPCAPPRATGAHSPTARSRVHVPARPRRLVRPACHHLAPAPCASSPGPPAPARPSSPVRSPITPAAPASVPSIAACRACSRNSPWPTPTAANPAARTPGAHRRAGDRRLGACTAARPGPARPARDLRGPLRRPLHHPHQPAPGRALARSPGRGYRGRCHLRSAAPQRTPDRPQGTVPAKENAQLDA